MYLWSFRDAPGTSANTMSVLKEMNLDTVATEEDILLVQEASYLMSQRAAYIVATGKSRYSYLMSQRITYIVATGKSRCSYLMSQRAAYIVATG
jgi:hypothetical protein